MMSPDAGDALRIASGDRVDEGEAGLVTDSASQRVHG